MRCPVAALFLPALAACCTYEAFAAAPWQGPASAFRDNLSGARDLPPPSKEITVRIYVDATSSMRGFVGRGAAGFPQQLQKLEQATHLIGPDIKAIQCFKFGTNPIQLPTGPCYAAVLRPDFFMLPKAQDTTKIESVIAKFPEDSLTIIVTDLFEEQADLGTVFQAFRDEVFKRKGIPDKKGESRPWPAVGIIAAKAGFNGPIFDIGLEKGTRNWVSDRPFYALVMGQPGDVTAYFSELARGAFPKDQLLILSGTLLKRAVSWDSASRLRTVGVSVDPDFISVERSGGSFGVLRLQNDTCELDLKLDTEQAPFHPRVDWSRVVVARQVRRFPRSAGPPEGVPLDDNAMTAAINGGKTDVRSLSATQTPARKGDNPGRGNGPGRNAGEPITLHLTWSPKHIRPAGRVYAEQILL
jgi:hypothetical protein